MIIMESNEKITNFRVRSIEKRFAKTDSFSHSKSTASKQKLPYLKLKSMLPYTIKLLPVATKTAPNPNLKNYKRIIPKTLHIPRPNSKKRSLDQKQNNDKNFNIETKISICYQSLLFQDKDILNQSSNITKAYWPNGGSLIVVKEISSMSKNSLNIFNEIDHPRIMKYIDIEHRNSSTFFYSQYNQNGNLQSLINSFGSLSQLLIKKITRQLVQSVQYVFQKNIPDINLKSSKVLVDHNSDIKLLIASQKKKQRSSNDTISIKQAVWTPPEQLMCKKTSEQSSLIWKIGCIVLHMATSKNPWCYKSSKLFNNTSQFLNVMKSQKTPSLPQQCSKQLSIFLNLCLQQNPQNRSSLAQIKKSKFLQTI